MTKSELIEKVAAATGTTKNAAATALDAVLANVAAAIKTEGRMQVPGIGTFTVKQRPARAGRNPQTGKAIKIAARKAVTFKAAPGLKDGLK